MVGVVVAANALEALLQVIVQWQDEEPVRALVWPEHDKDRGPAENTMVHLVWYIRQHTPGVTNDAFGLT